MDMIYGLEFRDWLELQRSKRPDTRSIARNESDEDISSGDGDAFAQAFPRLGGSQEHPASRVVSTSRTGRWTHGQYQVQDAIALAKEDHQEGRRSLRAVRKAKGDGRKEKLALEICKELTIHTIIEEEIFTSIEGKVDEDLLKESFVEHDAAEVSRSPRSRPANLRTNSTTPR